MTILETIKSLNKICNLDIVDICMDRNEDTQHVVKHKFAEEIILPIHCITNNVSYLLGKGKKEVITSDAVKCSVVEWKELHLLEMESEVNRIYNMSAWNFALRWYKYDHSIQSMCFIYMKLEKEG